MTCDPNAPLKCYDPDCEGKMLPLPDGTGMLCNVCALFASDTDDWLAKAHDFTSGGTSQKNKSVRPCATDLI